MLRATDATVMQADALLDLAHVHVHGGRTEEAAKAALEARMRYRLKGHIVGVRLAEARLQEVDPRMVRAAPAEADAAHFPM